MAETGYKNPGAAVQYTSHMSTVYTYDSINDIKACDGNTTQIPSSGGVNSTHPGPDATVWGFGFGIHLNARIDGIASRIRCTKYTYDGAIEDNIVKLREGNTGAVSYMGTEHKNTADWTTKSLSYRYYGSGSDLWGVNLTPARVNDWYFGFGMRPIGTSSTWATPQLDCMQMNVYYTMPTYGFNRTLPSTANLNTNFTYTIQLVNTNSVHQGYDIPVTITLPAGVQYVSHSTSNGYYNPSTGQFTAQLSGGQATLTITLKGTTVGNKTIVASVNGFSTTNSGTIQILDPTPSYSVTTGGDTTKGLGENATVTVSISGSKYNSTPIYFDVEHNFNTLSGSLVSSNNLSNIAFDGSTISCNVTNTTTGTFSLSYSFTVNTSTMGLHELGVHERETSIGDVQYVDITFSGSLNASGWGTQIHDQIFPNAQLYEIITQLSMHGVGTQLSTSSRAIGDIIKGYIGVIQLERSHSVAKASNTSTNKLIREGYKNRVNVGKTGDFEEDIPLQIKLPRRDAITLQGLVELDEPVPINTWAAAPDGDLLNHRGYAVIHKAKISRFNPQFYDCDIDLYYLTRNLDPPIYVRRLSQINRYDIRPQYPVTVLDSPSANLDDYFTVTAGGTRTGNQFDLSSSSGSPVKLRSINLLSTPLSMTLSWYGTMLDRERVYRYLRILDENNNILMEYRIYIYPNNGVYETYALVSVHDENDSIDNIEYPIELKIVTSTWSSVTHLNIVGNVVSILEEGNSGAELSVDNIIIPQGNYRVEYEIDHAASTTSSTVLDFVINETYLLTSLREQYINQVVSSFPLKDKEIQYTREAEDGVLYYYKHDDTVAKYYAQPFVIYKGGTNITTQDGGSLLSNRYRVDPIVLTNGLVKVMFSKSMKTINIFYYDIFSDDVDKWIHIETFQLENMENTYVNEITQDKASISCGETTWTIWRGRPFVDVNHNIQDILIHNVNDRYWHDNGSGVGTEVTITSDDQELSLNNLFYLLYYNNTDSYGLQVIKPDYTSIYADKIPRSSKTVLVPYKKVTHPYDEPSSLAAEWLNMYEQRIEIMR